MNKYVATYAQGNIAWIDARNLLEACIEADKLQEDHKEIPLPPKRFEDYKKSNWSEEISKRETSEYQDWKYEKARIEFYNITRRNNLIKVQEFMPKYENAIVEN